MLLRVLLQWQWRHGVRLRWGDVCEGGGVGAGQQRLQQHEQRWWCARHSVWRHKCWVRSWARAVRGARWAAVVVEVVVVLAFQLVLVLCAAWSSAGR